MKSAAFNAAPWSKPEATPLGIVRWLSIRACYGAPGQLSRSIYCVRLLVPTPGRAVSLSVFVYSEMIQGCLSIGTNIPFENTHAALGWIERSFHNE